MNKVLITGATGGLGSAVASFLREKNADQPIAVVVRDAESEKAKALAHEGFEIRVADYNETGSLTKAFEGIDTLYFVSGSDIANRMAQHKNVVEAAVSAQIDHIFYTSVSLNGLSQDAPLYGAMSSHLETEKWIKQSGINYTILRHNLYSEVIPMFLGSKDQLMASKMVYLPTSVGKTAFVPRAELAEAGANALANPSAHINTVLELNGSEKVTFSQVAEHLSEILGEAIGYISPTVAEFKQTMTQYGVPAEYIGMMSVFGLGIADGVFDSHSSDLEDLLGRKSLSSAAFLKQVYS